MGDRRFFQTGEKYEEWSQQLSLYKYNLVQKPMPLSTDQGIKHNYIGDCYQKYTFAVI